MTGAVAMQYVLTDGKHTAVANKRTCAAQVAWLMHQRLGGIDFCTTSGPGCFLPDSSNYSGIFLLRHAATSGSQGFALTGLI